MKVGVQTSRIAATRDRIKVAAWTVAFSLGEFSAGELSAAVGCMLETAQSIIKGWLVDGAVTETQIKHKGVRQRVRVNPDHTPSDAMPAGRTATDNMWFAARRLRNFSPTDLSAHATTDTISVSPEAAASYCRALLAAGYLRVSRKASPKSAREAIYNLARDTGPRPPREKRIRAMVDPNTDEVHLLGDHP